MRYIKIAFQIRGLNILLQKPFSQNTFKFLTKW